MRHSRTGSIQAAVQDAYTTFGGLEAVREATGISLATLSYGTDLNEVRPGGLGVNYLDNICRIEPKCAAIVAQHFAALAGGIYQPVELSGVNAGIAEHAGRLMRENSDVAAAVMAALASSCPKALDAVDAEVEDVIEEAVGLRGAIRAGREASR